MESETDSIRSHTFKFDESCPVVCQVLVLAACDGRQLNTVNITGLIILQCLYGNLMISNENISSVIFRNSSWLLIIYHHALKTTQMISIFSSALPHIFGARSSLLHEQRDHLPTGRIENILTFSGIE